VLASFDEPKRLVIRGRKSCLVLVAGELGVFLGLSGIVASVLVFLLFTGFCPSCRDSSLLSLSACGGIPCETFLFDESFTFLV